MFFVAALVICLIIHIILLYYIMYNLYLWTDAGPCQHAVFRTAEESRQPPVQPLPPLVGAPVHYGYLLEGALPSLHQEKTLARPGS